MRTKNAKRLWPVPATLAAVAVAAFLAVGLLATTGTQPAVAHDGEEHTTLELDNHDPLGCHVHALMGDTEDDDNAGGNQVSCSMLGTTGTITFVGDHQEATDADDMETSYYVYYPVTSGEDIQAYGPGTQFGNHDEDDTTDNTFYVGMAGENNPGVSIVKYGYKLIEVDAAKRGASGVEASRETLSVSGAAGKMSRVYVYRAGPALGTPDVDTGADNVPDRLPKMLPAITEVTPAGALLTVTFLGEPSNTRPDNESCLGLDLGDATRMMVVPCEDTHDKNNDGYVDADDKPDPSSDLYVADIGDDDAETEPTGVNVSYSFGAKSPHVIDGRTQFYLVAIIKDGEGNPLKDTGTNKAKGRVTFTITYASGSDIESNPITPQVVPVDMDGKAKIKLDHWDTEDDDGAQGDEDTIGPVSVTMTANYAGPTGTLDLGEVVVNRSGDSENADFATYSCDGQKKAKAKTGCADDYVAVADLRFGRGESFVVSGKFTDVLGTKTSDTPKLKTTGDARNAFQLTGVDNAGDDEFDTNAMLVAVESDAAYGDYVIEVNNGQSGDSKVSQELMVSVAGPPASYKFVDPVDSIELNGSAMFTIQAYDETMRMPHIITTEDDPEKSNDLVDVVVLGVDPAFVRGLTEGKVKLNDDGMGTFTVYAPFDATDGLMVRIIVSSGDTETSHSAALGTPMMAAPGMPMNVMAEATSDTMITVSWDAVMDATSYMVERGYMDADNMMMWMTVAEMTTDMMYMDSGLMAETAYYYRVTAMNDAGSGDPSDGMAMATTMMATTMMDELGTVTDVITGFNRGGALQVSWTKAANASGYIIIAINVNDVNNDVVAVVLNDGDLDTRNISGLTPGETYDIYVAATGSGGTFTLSAAAQVTAK